MAWLAVDKNHSEWIFQYKPRRNGSCWLPTISRHRNKDCVPLSKGTITKIIGKSMTWKDDPVKI